MGGAAGVKTIQTLAGLGVDQDDVVIGVQTKTDFDNYRRQYPRYQIHLSEGATNAAGNRNGLMGLFDGESCAFVDDDVLGFKRVVVRDGRTTTDELDEDGFKAMMELGANTGADIWGVNVGGNPYFHAGWLRRHGKVSHKALLIGDFMVMKRAGAVRFDDGVDMGEDYEICLTALEEGFDVARLNEYMVIQHKPNGKNDGGCKELYDMGDMRRHEMMRKQVVDKHRYTARFQDRKPTCCVVVKRRGML